MDRYSSVIGFTFIITPLDMRISDSLSPQFLPVEELYTPPLNIRLLDHRSFGVKPLVGTHMIKSLQEYRRDPVAMVQTIREKMLESG